MYKKLLLVASFFVPFGPIQAGDTRTVGQVMVAAGGVTALLSLIGGQLARRKRWYDVLQQQKHQHEKNKKHRYSDLIAATDWVFAGGLLTAVVGGVLWTANQAQAEGTQSTGLQAQSFALAGGSGAAALGSNASLHDVPVGTRRADAGNAQQVSSAGRKAEESRVPEDIASNPQSDGACLLPGVANPIAASIRVDAPRGEQGTGAEDSDLQLVQSELQVAKNVIQQAIKHKPKTISREVISAYQKPLIDNVTLLARLMRHRNKQVSQEAGELFDFMLRSNLVDQEISQSIICSLVELLKDADPQIKLSAVRIIVASAGKCTDQPTLSSMVSDLSDLVQDSCLDVRLCVANAFLCAAQNCTNKQTLKSMECHLLVLCKDLGSDVQATALKALYCIAQKPILVGESILGLEAYIALSSRKVSDATGQIPAISAIGTLAQGLTKDSFFIPSVKHLITLCEDQNLAVQKEAINSLGRAVVMCNDEDTLNLALTALMPFLSHSDQDVRKMTTCSLGSVGANCTHQSILSGVLDALKQLLGCDREEVVAIQAVNGIGLAAKNLTEQAALQDAVSFLIPLTNNEIVDVRKSAALALVNVAEKCTDQSVLGQMIAPLIALTGAEDVMIRSRAVNALSQVAEKCIDKKTLESIRNALCPLVNSDKDHDVRSEAARAIKVINSKPSA